MSNLKPSMVPLDKGLNLQVAKIVAPQGSILDTLNYEQVDFQGQKRIDGFTRFDGGQLAAIDEYYVVTLVGLGAAWAVNDLIASDTGMFGVVAKTEVVTGNKLLYVVVNNLNNLPAVGTQVYRIVSGVSQDGTDFSALTTGANSGVTPADHYTILLELMTALRARVEELPGPVAGLHWFRDRLHAIAGVVYASLEGTSPVLYPGDVLVCDGNTAAVLDSVVLGNTRAVFLDSMVPAPWLVEGNAVTRNAISVGAVANGYETLTIDEFASIFEARSEQQVLDEDAPGPYSFGWRFKHLGWKVLFDNGLSLFGSLPSSNQNIEGIGTQGPTSTAGNNGAASTVTQGVAITNMPTQVNGWKSFDTPTSYALNPSAIQFEDASSIYADAYLSWEAATGTVTGDTLVLTEYSPSATVEVDI